MKLKQESFIIIGLILLALILPRLLLTSDMRIGLILSGMFFISLLILYFIFREFVRGKWKQGMIALLTILIIVLLILYLEISSNKTANPILECHGLPGEHFVTDANGTCFVYQGTCNIGVPPQLERGCNISKEEKIGLLNESRYLNKYISSCEYLCNDRPDMYCGFDVMDTTYPLSSEPIVCSDIYDCANVKCPPEELV